MLKITVQRGGKVETEIEGSIEEITAGTIVAVSAIYESIEEKNKEAARKFKSHILEDINLCFMNEDIIRRRNNELEGMIEDIKDTNYRDIGENNMKSILISKEKLEKVIDKAIENHLEEIDKSKELDMLDIKFKILVYTAGQMIEEEILKLLFPEEEQEETSK